MQRQPEVLQLEEGGRPVGQGQAQLGLVVRGGEDGLRVEREGGLRGAGGVLLVPRLSALLGLELVLTEQSLYRGLNCEGTLPRRPAHVQTARKVCLSETRQKPEGRELQIFSCLFGSVQLT